MEDMGMSRTIVVRRLLRGALCGMTCGHFGPLVPFVLAAWGTWQGAPRFVRFFAALVRLYGGVAGLVNGIVGTGNGLRVGRHQGGWPVEFIPLVMVALAWVWDR